MKIRTHTMTLTTVKIAWISLLVFILAVSTAVAQEGERAAQTRNQEEKQIKVQDPQGETLRERIRERIENEEGLQDQERERLRQHLGECKQLGLDENAVAALFSESSPLKNQIRTQERVLTMARQGLPVDPVIQKLQEGRRKGVNEGALERVCARMEEHVRAAHRFMKRVHEDGVTPGNADAERLRTREMAMHMWRGLKDDEMQQLRERARQRLRDGSCTTSDVAAAAETAVRLKEMGIERQRAVRLAGNALQHGYTPREMRQLSWMVMTAHMHGGPKDEVINTIENGIRNQHQLSQMIQQMWRHGWMGPADEHGGHSPMDGETGSGPGGHQGGEKNQDGKGGHGHGGNGQ